VNYTEYSNMLGHSILEYYV